MKTKTIFCSACDREVLIQVTDDAKADASLDGAVCLDIGAACTGTLCPICAVPPEDMRKQVRKQK